MPERIDVEALRAAYPVADVVTGAGVGLRHSGRRLVGRCPFHDDRDPSLVVYPETQSYFCFGCDSGGDVIDFVCRLHSLSFLEAVEWLAGRGARCLPARVTPLLARPVAARLTAEEAAILEAATSHYAAQLRRSRRGRAYLARRRVDARTATALRLGYGSGRLARHLRLCGLDREVAAQLGLLAGGREPFEGRVVIPDLRGGRATWLTGRSLDSRGPRYLNLRRLSPLLGLAAVRESGATAVLVTEGPFDWLTACTWEVPAVALLGTHVSRHALQALRAFQRVHLVLDADEAGRRATDRLVAALGERALPVRLPRGIHDLSELGTRRDGRDVLLRLLSEARARQESMWDLTDRSDRARAA